MSFFKTSDGVKLYYQQKGEGNTIMLVHGWSADHTSYDQVFDELSKNYQVISYDLRGHGISDRPEKGLSIKRFATDLEELMDYLNLQEVTLVGHSMGASISFEYVKNFGVQRLKSVSIFDMTPKLINEGDWNLGLYHGKYTREDSLNDLTVINEDLIKFAKSFIKIAVPYLTDDLMKEQLDLLINNNTPHVLSAMWHAMAVSDFRDVLPNLTVPTQIVYGEKSTLYSKESADYLASKIPDAKVIPFKNCTHLLIVENPAKTAQVIEEIAKLSYNHK
ncbi:alpha/beta fold hydrolase [Metasolibacillus meyeri]|uniref:alpha/beta fold hydrolase n=1 Tax=Metasolibacillus meyeri TaxID=1071052 RepID=UPI000D309806|nr:alpha/beta hydrolase [Metasolibacillus meyeri]